MKKGRIRTGQSTPQLIDTTGKVVSDLVAEGGSRISPKCADFLSLVAVDADWYPSWFVGTSETVSPKVFDLEKTLSSYKSGELAPWHQRVPEFAG
jgi:hypothetical protein